MLVPNARVFRWDRTRGHDEHHPSLVSLSCGNYSSVMLDESAEQAATDLAARVEHLEFALNAVRGQLVELRDLVDQPRSMHQTSISENLAGIESNITAWLEPQER